jgi:ferredoxin
MHTAPHGILAGAAAGGLEVSRFRLVLDPTACDGHGLCAELFPEGIALDDWGFPLIGEVPEAHLSHARRAVAACPALALRLRGPA